MKAILALGIMVISMWRFLDWRSQPPGSTRTAFLIAWGLMWIWAVIVYAGEMFS